MKGIFYPNTKDCLKMRHISHKSSNNQQSSPYKVNLNHTNNILSTVQLLHNFNKCECGRTSGTAWQSKLFVKQIKRKIILIVQEV